MDSNEDPKASSSSSTIEDKIIQLAKEKETGVSNKEIQEAIPDVPASEWTKIINKLLKSGYILSLKLHQQTHFTINYIFLEH